MFQIMAAGLLYTLLSLINKRKLQVHLDVVFQSNASSPYQYSATGFFY